MHWTITLETRYKLSTRKSNNEFRLSLSAIVSYNFTLHSPQLESKVDFQTSKRVKTYWWCVPNIFPTCQRFHARGGHIPVPQTVKLWFNRL
jgi:hypothetical protein